MISRISRLLAELRSRPSEHDGEEALSRLVVTKVAADTLEIGEGEHGRRLDDLLDDEAKVVRVARDVYARIPTRESRVQLLRLARSAATKGVSLHVTIGDEQSHVGRLLVDAPRRLLRAARVPVAAPGDRFGPHRYAHCFFDEEELLGEVDSADLRVVARKGFRFDLTALDHDVERTPEDAEAFAIEVGRALALVPAVDRGRGRDTPEHILAAMRARGVRSARLRGPIGRARLRRAIGWVDAMSPGGASCYRRVLLESALDAGAARETVVFGLDVGRTGHVAFEDREERSFDVSFAIPGDASDVEPA